MAASSAALFLGIDSKFIKDGIKNFKGVKRRFEIISENPLIIHDYAHHPTEITATLKACREIKKAGKIICIFQPHTYSRTRDLFDDFVKCFSLADEVWLLPIYPAREKAIRGITSKRLAKEISKNGQKCRYFSSFSECKEQLLKKEQFDLCAILGAGDIEKLAYSLKE